VFSSQTITKHDLQLSSQSQLPWRDLTIQGDLSNDTATSVSAVAKRLRDASCLSVVSFNTTKRRVVFYFYLRRLQIYHCVQLKIRCSVVFGVTLRLLVITFRRLLPQSTPRLTTSDVSQLNCGMVAVVHRRLC